MKDYFKPKSWLIAALMFIIAFGLSSAMVYYEFGLKKNIKITSAGASDNVSGYAWNSNVGWISFNATDCDSDSNGKVDVACGSDNASVNIIDYGVNIDSVTRNFSGYAWSSGVGWISFNRSDTGNPPGQPNNSGNGPIADYNKVSGEVKGWAKILSLGDNGWIKLRKFSSDVNPPGDYGVSIAGGNFSGWAWNANDDVIPPGGGIGWISFNCSDVPKSCQGGTNAGTPCPIGNECLGGGICVDTCTALSNYKVIADISGPPTVKDMKAPNWSYKNAAEDGALNAYLDWTFSGFGVGASESAYQVIVNINNNINNPFFDSGKCTAYTFNGPCQNGLGVGHFPLQLALSKESKSLEYNKAYHWWVMVWDENGNDSGWEQYNANPDDPLEADDRGTPPNNNKTFTTYKHEFPKSNITWFAFYPSRGEKVKFTSINQTYKSAPDNPAMAVPCDDSLCEYLWTIPDDASFDNPTDAATSTPIITFNSAGLNKVTLKVTDKIDGYYTETELPIEVNVKLPKWREVKPE